MSDLANELRKFHKPVPTGVTTKQCMDDGQAWPCNTEIALLRREGKGLQSRYEVRKINDPEGKA